MEAEEINYESGPIFDALDVDLVVKVLSHTALSKLQSYRIKYHN